MELRPGTRVMVTGASRGIGEALARAFAERGCVLGLVARSKDELEELAGSLPGDGHVAIPADVADLEAMEGAVAAFDSPEVVVANAGVANYGRFVDIGPAEYERMTTINWLGTLHTVRAALPSMLERRRGHLVIVSSGAGLRTFPEAAVYGGTKSAQRGFSEGLRHELADTGISLTTVYPGEIRSHLHDHEKEKMPAWYRSEQAADPAELARRVVAGVEKDARAVYYPPLVRLLRIVHGISPAAGDALLRALRGRSAAPRR